MWLRVRMYRLLIRIAASLRMRGYMDGYYYTMHVAMRVLFGPK